MRQGAEKDLVNAILDAEIDADDIAERATELGKTLAQRLTVLLRNLIKLRVARKITADKAQQVYIQVFISLTLIGFAKVAQDVKDHGESSVKKIVDAARVLGKDVRKVTAIRNIEKKARITERQNGG
jgi:hypothetical protein